MRKVIYKEWVPRIWVSPDGTEHSSKDLFEDWPLKEGTGIQIDREGYFMQIVSETEDGRTYTMALIEDMEGHIVSSHVSNVRFAEPYSKNVEEIERFLSR